MASGTPILLWVAVVACDSLGLLLGKDLLRSVGARVDFDKGFSIALG